MDWIRDHGWQTWLIASLLLAGAEMTRLDLSLLMMAVGAAAGCERQQVPSDVVRGDAVKIGQHQRKSKEDRVVEESLRGHQDKAHDRAGAMDAEYRVRRLCQRR